MAFFTGVRDRMQPARSDRFELTVFGETLISRGFLTGAGRLRDMRPAWHAMHDLFLEEFLRNFRSEGSYASGGWAPLAPATKARKVREGLDNGILQRHRRLMGSLTEKGHPDQRVKITKKSFEMASTVEYGPYHQAGTSNMPARPPASLREAARRGAFGVIHRHAMGLAV